MKFINENGVITFEDFKYYTKSYDNTPDLSNKRYSVIDKDEDIIFTSGLRNKSLKIELLPIKSSIQERVLLYREIKKEFLIGGEIIIDAEPDVKYKCRVLKGSSISYSGNYDTISVTFDLSPTATESIDINNMTWDGADIPWSMANVPWDGVTVTYPPGDGSVTLVNRGNYESYPILEIFGDLSITCNGKTFTIFDNFVWEETSPGVFIKVYQTVFVDCDKMIVYNSFKTSRMSVFSGEFIKFEPGDNEIVVSDAFSNHKLENVTNISRWV